MALKVKSIFLLLVQTEEEQKYSQLNAWGALPSVDQKNSVPDERHTWLTEGQQEGFSALLPLGIKGTKTDGRSDSVFRLFSLGAASNRDAYNYNSSGKILEGHQNCRLCI